MQNPKLHRLVAACAIALSASLSPLLLPKAQAQTQTPLPLVPYNGTQILDWTQINFRYFGGMHQAGQFAAPGQMVSYLGFNPSVSWQAGTPVSNVIRLGFVDRAFGLQQLSLDQIAAATGTNPANLPLANYGLLKWQTLGSLVRADTTLENLPVNAVPPLAQLVAAYPIDYERSSAETLGQLASQAPYSMIPLQPILNSYSIGSIPGLSGTVIQNFQLWQQAFIADIPNLSLLTFSHFPIQPQQGNTFSLSPVKNPVSIASASLQPGLFSKSDFDSPKASKAFSPEPISNLAQSLGIGDKPLLAQVPVYSVAGAAIFDLPLTGEQFITTGVVSGSDRVGFNFPCNQGACDHAELGQPFLGARWIVGSLQNVKGGWNLLGSIGGGLEPTGRPLVGNPDPEAEPFKLVLNNVNGGLGTATVGLAMHFCIHHSFPDPLPNPDCTPYEYQFPGIWTWHEKDVMFVGGPGSPVPR